MAQDTKTECYCYDGDKPLTIVKWKIKVGSQLFYNSVILSYKYDGSGDAELKEPLLKFKSAVGGTVLQLLADEGDTIKSGSILLKFEPCSHPVIMKDLCAECGTDLRHLDKDNFAKLTAATTFSMVHVVPELKVSLEQAEKLGRDDVDRLLKGKKLVLLVDLDQTLIHTTNDNVLPNLKDVYHFQLYGQYSPWYHTKLRPGTRKFLENISKYYELHICTFGARLYAHKIAQILDPDGKLFSHRILSRDECFDATSKTGNLKALFPCGDAMVCIIDDREDVWNFAPNVIHVKPYCFFRNTGDINAPPPPPPKDGEVKSSSTENSQEPFSNNVEKPPPPPPPPEVKPEEKVNETQEEKENESSPKGAWNEAADNDDYLLYLEEILITVHKAYYDIYEQMLVQGEKNIPDLKTVVPYVRQKVLRGINIVFSSIIPTNCDAEANRFWTLAKSLGANVARDMVVDRSERRTTHVVASKLGTAKLNTAKKHKDIRIVSLDWLFCCAERWEKADEKLFPLRKDIGGSRQPEGGDSDSGRSRRWLTCGTRKNCRRPQEKEVSEEEKFAESVLSQAGLSLSREDIEDMDREVDEACSSEDSDDENKQKRKKDSDSSSAESLSAGDYPRCWKKKRKASESEKSEHSESSDVETIGSVDEEMAEAVEREFNKLN